MESNNTTPASATSGTRNTTMASKKNLFSDTLAKLDAEIDSSEFDKWATIKLAREARARADRIEADPFFDFDNIDFSNEAAF